MTIVGLHSDKLSHYMIMLEKTPSVSVASIIVILILPRTCHLTWWTMFQETFQTTHSNQGSRFLVDSEAVIRMIIKGRSVSLRHVSRTHRVDFDWLFFFFNGSH